jgi:hypothetical protein
MCSEDLWIEKSCETYILKRVPFLISAFPGYLVFGQTDRGQKYEELSCLKFNFYEYSKLSDCITRSVIFIAEDNKDTNVIDICENQKVAYQWQGVLKTNDNLTEKYIKFIISNGLQSNELIFSLIEFNNLIRLIKRCILSSLCLKDEEEVFISDLIKKDADFIISCKTTLSVASDFAESYLKSKCVRQLKKASYIELMCYHNENLLVLKNLDEIFCEDG